MRAAYPKAFPHFSKDEYERLVEIWYCILRDFSVEEGMNGLLAFIAQDKEGFPPSPGQVIDKINGMRCVPDYPTAEEAWACVRRAISDGVYHAEERFRELPPICQEVIASPGSLEAMALLPSEEVETIEMSHFLKAYNRLIAHKKEEAALPASIREQIAQTRAAAPHINTNS